MMKNEQLIQQNRVAQLQQNRVAQIQRNRVVQSRRNVIRQTNNQPRYMNINNSGIGLSFSLFN